MWENINNEFRNQHIDASCDVRLKKTPYTPPMLSLLELDDIASGAVHINENDAGVGGGVLS
jgi:hypothetical protein